MRSAVVNSPASSATSGIRRKCKTCKIIQKIREDAEQRDVSPDMVLKYREGDTLTDLLIKVISL